jgi:acyl carrier protein
MQSVSSSSAEHLASSMMFPAEVEQVLRQLLVPLLSVGAEGLSGVVTLVPASLVGSLSKYRGVGHEFASVAALEVARRKSMKKQQRQQRQQNGSKKREKLNSRRLGGRRGGISARSARNNKSRPAGVASKSRDAIADTVRSVVSLLLGDERPADDATLMDLGLDSLGATELSSQLSQRLGVKVLPTLLFSYPTMAM